VVVVRVTLETAVMRISLLLALAALARPTQAVQAVMEEPPMTIRATLVTIPAVAAAGPRELRLDRIRLVAQVVRVRSS
jgi:hypothetical protein